MLAELILATMGNHNNSYAAGALSIRICFMRYVGKSITCSVGESYFLK